MARYYRSNLPTLKDLSSLPIADLKKIVKAYEAYEIKKEKCQSDYAIVEARNTNIDRQNAQTAARKEQWEKQYMAPLYAEMNRIDQALRECSVGFFAQFVADSFVFEGERYKPIPGRKLAQQRLDLQKRIETSQRSGPTLNFLPKEYTQTRFPKRETNLKIGGATLKIDFDSLDIEEVEKLIEAHEQKQANEKAKVMALQAKLIEQRAVEKEKVTALRARVTSSEKETREQAKKFKRDLHKQVAKVSCCPYCEGSITDQNVHLDHIWPVSKGGQSSAKNLVFVCDSCNKNKTNLTLRAFLMKYQLDASEVHKRLELLEKDF